MRTMTNAYHRPVMLEQCLEALQIKPDGVYVDATFGGGGHSAAILERMGSNGSLYAFDQDADALGQAVDDPRLVLIKSNFRFLAHYLRYFDTMQVDGVLADLGISSHQIDEGERGFAFMQDGPLDMRMDRDTGIPVSEWLSGVSLSDLVHVLSAYGEVKNAKSLASAMLSALPLNTTADLAKVCEVLAPRGRRNKYLAQVFQAQISHPRPQKLCLWCAYSYLYPKW